MMDQFKDGLEAAGLLKYMKKHYHLLAPLFVCETNPTKFTASKRNHYNNTVMHNTY